MSGVERGTITWRGDPLPFPGEADGSSFVELLGGTVNRPLADGVADAIERFRRLLARGLVLPPPAARWTGRWRRSTGASEQRAV